MMEEKRLSELLKQRALIEAHLAWLDAEIGAIQGTPSTPAASGVPSNRLASIVDTAGESAPAPSLPVDEPDPKLAIPDIYDELGPDTRDSAKDAQRGCLAIFAVAFLALAGIALWVWFKY